MTTDQFNDIKGIKESIDQCELAIDFPNGIFIINPEFMTTGAYKGELQALIDQSLAANNVSLDNEIVAKRALRQAEFDSINITIPKE